MRTHKRVTNKEAKLLKQLRGYDKDECIEIWDGLKANAIRQVPPFFWQKLNHRKYIVEAFIEQYQETHPGRYPTERDFIKNKLSGLLQIYYDNSPLLALIETGFTDKKSKYYDLRLEETPWLVLGAVPRNYWGEKSNAKKAVDWLSQKTGRNVTELESDNFEENSLYGLLKHYNYSPINIIKAAGYEVEEMQRNMTSQRYWENPENRIKAVKDLVKKLDKSPIEVTWKDFLNNGISGLLEYYDSHKEALAEAGFACERKRKPTNYWANVSNRINATKDLAATLEKPVEEIKKSDFICAGLAAILPYCSGHREALQEAGLLPENT